jgi:hypothetical protein
MPTTYAVPDGRTVMAATLYTGTGAAQSVSNAVNGVSFQPDFIWAKARSSAESHRLQDSIRGATKSLFSNSTAAETTEATGITAFTSNGFTLGSGTPNGSGITYVGWQWKAGGTAVTNTAGSITSTVSANPTAGFSVVTYTGTGASATVGHGLGVAPGMVIVKNRSITVNWLVWHRSFPSNQLYLNLTNALDSPPDISSIGSSTFAVNSWAGINGSGNSMVAYCFAPVAGYSAFGSYTGNGSADGPFVYLGFRPRFVLFKRTDSTGDWWMFDTARSQFNVMTLTLRSNLSDAETDNSATQLDSLSNGFKMRGTGTSFINLSGGTYIFMAFAENPFKYANAR